MQTIGRIRGIAGNTIMLELDTLPDFPIETLVNVELKRYSQKRSLTANSYFHVLVDKLRQALGISFAACKNTLVTSYGQIEYIDDEPVVIKTNIPPETMIENEFIHAKPVYVKDADAFFYRIYKPTHTLTAQEFGKLIDGTVEECKTQNIETLSPAELLRLEGYAKYINK